MKRSGLWVFLLWILGMSFLGDIYFKAINLTLNINRDVIAMSTVFSVICLGVSNCFIHLIFNIRSQLLVIFSWIICMSLIGYFFLKSSNMDMNASYVYYIIIIDFCGFISCVWGGVSQWFVESINISISNSKNQKEGTGDN